MVKLYLFIIAVFVLFLPIEIKAGQIELGQTLTVRNDGAGISLTSKVVEIVDETPRFEIDVRFGKPQQVFLDAKLESYEEFILLYKKIIDLDLTKADKLDGRLTESTFLQLKKNKKSQEYVYYYKNENHPETCAAINKLLYHVQDQLAPKESKPMDSIVKEQDADADKKRSFKELRVWTNQQGKSIKASFIKLEGATITLQKEDGSVVSFSTKLLSEQSMQQAKDLHEKSK